jgi:hypothetical protein
MTRERAATRVVTGFACPRTSLFNVITGLDPVIHPSAARNNLWIAGGVRQ